MSDTKEYRRGWAEGYKAAKDSLQAMLRGEYSKGYQDGMEDDEYSKGYQDGMEDERRTRAELEGGDDE